MSVSLMAKSLLDTTENARQKKNLYTLEEIIWWWSIRKLNGVSSTLIVRIQSRFRSEEKTCCMHSKEHVDKPTLSI